MNKLHSEVVDVESSEHCEARQAPVEPRLVAAYLYYDGYLKLPNQIGFVPITEPFYTLGRPEREAVPGGTCDCISDGGIPILSDRLFNALTQLGAMGETAELIYRGFNKKQYDTIQKGYRRFQASPVYPGDGISTLTAQLPCPLPPVFGIVSTHSVSVPEPGIAKHYHIGLSRESLEQLKNSMPRVVVMPLLRKSE